MIDVKEVEALAKKEIAEETAKTAVNKLKDLYRSRERAALVLRNIDREITAYLADVSDNTIYEGAGVNVTK